MNPSTASSVTGRASAAARFDCPDASRNAAPICFRNQSLVLSLAFLIAGGATVLATGEVNAIPGRPNAFRSDAHYVVYDVFRTPEFAAAFPYAPPTFGPDGKIYGTTDGVGQPGNAAVWRMNRDGTDFIVLRHFNAADEGRTPRTSPLFGADGKLYGTTVSGGVSNSGVLWRMNADGTGFVVLRHFNAMADGGYPEATVFGPDGRLYGTSGGGASARTDNTPPGGSGTVWRINTDGSGFGFVRRFGLENPSATPGTPVFGPDGRIYGSIRAGGARDLGTVWRMNADGTGYVELRHLDFDREGASPMAPVFGPDGRVYGATPSGGTNDRGTIWRMNADGSGFVVLRVMNLSNGGAALPPGPFVFGADGRLYGGGMSVDAAKGSVTDTIWRMNADGSDFVVLHDLGLQSGTAPLFGPDGRLYGTFWTGGEDRAGAVWRMNPDGSDYFILRHFTQYTNRAPCGPPLFGADGQLYGATTLGGLFECGTVWRMAPDGRDYSIIAHLWDDPPQGKAPYGPLTLGPNGEIYGTCFAGGTGGVGTVWRLNLGPFDIVFAVLRQFDRAADGAYPQGGPTVGHDGTLFGTNSSAGEYGFSTAWRMNRDGTGFGVLRHFNSSTDGEMPRGSPTIGPDGRLYGVNFGGGKFGNGTVWRMAVDGSGFVVLRHLEPTHDGGLPLGPPVFDADGKLYGFGYVGGPKGDGTLWRMNADGSGFAVLHDFNRPSDGAAPIGSPMVGPDGRIYGTANEGGPATASFGGTLWRMNADGSEFVVLHGFSGFKDGRSPWGPPVFGPDGKLYGTTRDGGPGGGGVVYVWSNEAPRAAFTFTPSAADAGTVLTFNAADTTDPEGDGRVYEWDFGDGTAGEVAVDSPTVTHAFLSAGSYTVTLQVTDSYGATSGPVTAQITAQPATQPPGLVLNGNFETGGAGWAIGGNVIIQSSPRYAATDGSNAVLFNAGDTPPNGTLTQSFSTTPGRAYIVQFDVGVLAFNTSEQRLQVGVQGTSTLVSQTISLPGPGGGLVRWMPQAYAFVADSATTTLIFRDVSPATKSVDLLLDHVRVTPLLLNGSFETGAVGWTATGNVAVLAETRYAATDGRYVALFNAGETAPNGRLTQSFATATGQAYSLRYDTGVRAFNKKEQRLQVTAQGNSTQLSQTVSVIGRGDGLVHWTRQSEVFVADGPVTTLSFVDTSPTTASLDLLLDHIEVTPLLLNGSFEQGSSGWTRGGNTSVATDIRYAATDGGSVALFNATETPPDGVLMQSFPTTAGRTYRLRFDAAARAFNGKEQRLLVTVAGDATLVTKTISLFGGSDGTPRWSPQSWTFVADGNAATVSFRDASTTTTSVDLLLDNVRIE